MRLCGILRNLYRNLNNKEYIYKKILSFNMDIVKCKHKYSSRMESGEQVTVLQEGVHLSNCVELLNKFAGSYLAEDWDNVGLIVDNMTKSDIIVKKVLLTIDLTESVVDEALEKDIDLIISYHPPLFHPIKELNKSNWKLFIIGLCAINKIAVYSPHTAWDAIDGGVADWLLDAFSSYTNEHRRYVIQPVKSCFTSTYNVTLGGPVTQILKVMENFPFLTLCQRDEKKSSVDYAVCNGFCNYETLLKLKQIPGISVGSMECMENKKNLHIGMGRIMNVQGLNIKKSVELIKIHTGLKYVRIALATNKTQDSEINKLAVLPGSGGSFLSHIKKEVDMYITGEMSHHEVLDATQSGTSVILLNHTDSERGFLTIVKPKLDELFNNKVTFLVSQVDKDPLQVL